MFVWKRPKINGKEAGYGPFIFKNKWDGKIIRRKTCWNTQKMLQKGKAVNWDAKWQIYVPTFQKFEQETRNMARVTLGKKRMLNERSAFVVAKSTRTYFVRTLLPQVGLEKMKVNTEQKWGELWVKQLGVAQYQSYIRHCFKGNITPQFWSEQ